MTSITLHDYQTGDNFAGDFAALETRESATIGITSLPEHSMAVPTVQFDDGTTFTWSDWQSAQFDGDDVLASLAEGHPIGTQQWVRSDGTPAIVLDGLPRVLG